MSLIDYKTLRLAMKGFKTSPRPSLLPSVKPHPARVQSTHLQPFTRSHSIEKRKIVILGECYVTYSPIPPSNPAIAPRDERLSSAARSKQSVRAVCESTGSYGDFLHSQTLLTAPSPPLKPQQARQLGTKTWRRRLGPVLL